MTHAVARSARTLAALACATLTAATLAPGAGALAVPLDPGHVEVAEQWVNPAIRPGEGSNATLTLIDVPTSTPNGMFHVKLRVTNTSDHTLSDPVIVPRRGPATGSVVDQRVATVASISEYALVGEPEVLRGKLGPGASRDVELDVGVEGTNAAVFPWVLQLIDEDGVTMDTQRFHIAVRPETGSLMPDGARSGGITALYPISAPVDVLPGETGEAPEDPPLILASEQLAEQLAPGGRLDELVDTYLDATTNPQVGLAACAALDPALIDAADRMSRGYTVAETRPPVVEEPKRLRDSWGSGEDVVGEPGRGAADAAAWLEKVRLIAATQCTVALPWANTDLNAVVRTGDPWLMREAIERGPFVLGRVLGNAGTLNVVVPGTGYVTDDAIGALGWADHAHSTIPQEGLSGAWERALEYAAGTHSAPGSDAGRSSLEGTEMAAPAWAAAPAPAPETPVRVLVAKNSVQAPNPAPAPSAEGAAGAEQAALTDTAERFAWLAPGIMAVRYQDSLAATLATVGEYPTTVGYSNDAQRFDYGLDSPRARGANAAAAVQLAAQGAWTYEGQNPAEPVLVQPPATWSAEDAATVLGTVAALIERGAANPVTFASYLTPPEGATVAAATSSGAPFADPTVYSDSEVLAATQQARFINDLSTLLAPDPSIALTRYGFTLPLRRDILQALSAGERASIAGYADAAAATADRLAGSRKTLQDLRASVTLIPPGNVYTRTSPTSPLLIVARNGMPLPVDTAIRYSAADSARLNVPETLRIPARGSVTVQMTADLPPEARSTNLQLFLAGPQGRAISQPVEISVRTPRMALRGWFLVAAGGAVLALFALYGLAQRRRRAGPKRKSPSSADTPGSAKTTSPDTTTS